MNQSNMTSVFVKVLAITLASAGVVRADNNSRLYDLEKRVAALEDVVFQRQAPGRVSSCSNNSRDIHSAPVGFSCRTSKGSVLLRVEMPGFGEAWRTPDGTIWGDFIGSFTQSRAIDECTRLGGILPSHADFERGAASGIYEVLPNANGRRYWSSTVHPSMSDNALSYAGPRDGQAGYEKKDFSKAVRCISK